MLQALFLGWLVNAVAGGAVNMVASRMSGPPAPVAITSMAMQESVRLGYIGQLMENCAPVMGWSEETMLEILKRGTMRAATHGASQDMIESSYDIGARDASRSFSGDPAALPLVCVGAKKEVIAYVHGLDFDEVR